MGRPSARSVRGDEEDCAVAVEVERVGVLLAVGEVDGPGRLVEAFREDLVDVAELVDERGPVAVVVDVARDVRFGLASLLEEGRDCCSGGDISSGLS